MLTYSKVIALITPYAIDTAGWKFYILFCVMILLNIPFTYFFLPEVSLLTPIPVMRASLTNSRRVEKHLKSLITSSLKMHSTVFKDKSRRMKSRAIARRALGDRAFRSRSRFMEGLDL